MTNSRHNDDEYRKDFEESVFVEELSFDTIPAELMAEFESSAFGHLVTSDDEIDVWSVDTDAIKREVKR